MGAPTLAEFTTGVPAVNAQTFSAKDLQCIRIQALAAIAALGSVAPVTDYSANLANSSTGLVAVATSLIGTVPDERAMVAKTMMLAVRAGGNSTTTVASIMSSIKTLRECDPHQINLAELYITALLMQSLSL